MLCAEAAQVISPYDVIPIDAHLGAVALGGHRCAPNKRISLSNAFFSSNVTAKSRFVLCLTNAQQ